MILKYENIKEENSIERLDGQCIMDLISVNVNSQKDWYIFTKWYNDFKKRDIPFFITDDIKLKKGKSEGTVKTELWKTLWLQEIIPPTVNNANPKDRLIFDIANTKG